MQLMFTKKLNNKAFTIVELMVTIVVMSTITIIIFGLMYTFIRNTSVSDGRANMAYEMQTTLNRIEADIALSTEFLPTIDGNFSDPLGPNDSGAIWNSNGVSVTQRNLIVRGLAATKDVTDETKAPVFENLYGCDPTLINSNPVIRTNIIYFVKNKTLFRRALTDVSKITCNPQFQKQSCTEHLIPSNPICQVADQKVLEDVGEFRVTYMVAPPTGETASPSSASTTVKVTIKIDRVIYGEKFNFSSSILTTKINSEN